MVKFAELLPIWGLLIVGAQAKGYYTITSPGSVRPNSKFSVHVSVFDIWENSRISLTLQGPQYEKIIEVVVPPNSGQNATFELGDITNGVYTLMAQGLSGIFFENSTNLEFVENLPMIYLQTDKALYRSSDTIYFRIICLDQYLLPAKVNQSLSVVLKDSQNIIIERFDNIALNTGVYKGEYKLTGNVVPDEWSVQVFLGQKMLAKKFVEVKDYELPPFEMDLDAPSYVTFREAQFVASVRFRNEAMNSLTSGRCILTIISKTNEIINRRIHHLNNCKKGIPVNLNKLERVMQNIMVNVTVQFKAHGTHTVSKFVRFVPNLYIINMPSMSYECHEPNEVFVYRAHIYNYNGNPIDGGDEIRVTLNPGTNGMPETFFSHVNDEGCLDVQIKCSNSKIIYVTINYKGTQSKPGKIELKHLNRKEGVHVNTQFPTIDNAIEVQLASRETFNSFVCVILGRGNIVYSNNIDVPNRAWRQTHTFSITPTYEMMPEAHMFVYFFKNGNMVYYETTFSVKSEFQNTIFLDTPETIKPGIILSLNVFTEPNSYVGLLGMEENAFNLQSENNLNAKQIFRDLSNVQSKTTGVIAGLVTMTNANHDLVKIYTPVIKERAPIRKQTTQRNYFETFAFNDYVSVSGYDEVVLKLPTTFFKSWIITGFAINPKTGFALTTSRAMKTLKEIHIDIDVPQAVQRGSTITLKAEVYNYSRRRTPIYVTLEKEKDEFEFVKNVGKISETLRTDIISPGKSKPINFQIRPKVNGMITLKLTASCPWAIDVNIKKLKVVGNSLG
ncbi:CD109 antigen isoform X2 [Zeugodacus cucurbitae]|nr:CD109 antigen isoform X2 [Zeugodacus cucurbitae]XP_054082288.1 CD109 antigen isoform X2 [Zeugodacus cucurbitae]